MDDADLRLQSLWIVEVDMVAIGLGVSIQPWLRTARVWRVQLSI